MDKNKFTCGYCDYKTTSKSNMKCHIKQVHEGKCYECNICGAFVKNLSQHMINICKIKKRIKNLIVIDEGCGSNNQKKTTSDDQPQSNSSMPNDIQILLGLSPSPTSNNNPTSNNDPRCGKMFLKKNVIMFVCVTKTT